MLHWLLPVVLALLSVPLFIQGSVGSWAVPVPISAEVFFFRGICAWQDLIGAPKCEFWVEAWEMVACVAVELTLIEDGAL